jgi:hypothetical protein
MSDRSAFPVWNAGRLSDHPPKTIIMKSSAG